MPTNAAHQRAASDMEKEVASRIMALRVDSGYTQEQMADMTGFSLTDYIDYEGGRADLPFSWITSAITPILDLLIRDSSLFWRLPLVSSAATPNWNS